MMACISAYELGFIKVEESLDKIEHIIETVERLEKWNGHLYNWYDIKTMTVINPQFVSTVDSGNLVASYIVAREFLENPATLLQEMQHSSRDFFPTANLIYF